MSRSKSIEWSNYTNWPYNYIPFDSYPAIEELGYYYNSENTNSTSNTNVTIEFETYLKLTVNDTDKK